MLFQIKYPTGCEKTDKMTHRIRDLVLVFSVASRPPDKYRRERDLLGSFAGDPAGVGWGRGAKKESIWTTFRFAPSRQAAGAGVFMNLHQSIHGCGRTLEIHTSHQTRLPQAQVGWALVAPIKDTGHWSESRLRKGASEVSRIWRQLRVHRECALHSECHLEEREAFSLGAATDWSPSGNTISPHLAELLSRHQHKGHSYLEGLWMEDVFPMPSVSTAAINSCW